MRSWFDKPLAEDEIIDAAHPLRTGKHWELYERARLLVGACRSKDKLINLVNWLLVSWNDAIVERARDNINSAEKWAERSAELLDQQHRMVTHNDARWMDRKLVVTFEDTGLPTHLDPDVIRFREAREKTGEKI